MYEDLERLNNLREKGAITEEEYQREKDRILNQMNSSEQAPIFDSNKNLWGMDERNYCTLMHISQFAGIIVPLAGFILPIMMWIMNKDNNEAVDKNGRMILNWMISLTIWAAVSAILIFIFIGVALLIALGVLNIIFVINGAMKANKGEFYNYPLTIKFF